MADLKVYKMRSSDLDAVVEIENESFSLPWSRWMFEREVEDSERSHFLLIKDDNKTLGYIGFWMIFDEAHIVTIAVKGDCRRRGIGTGLMSAALSLAKDLGARRATLEVRVTNTPAQNMYEMFGFEIVSIRKKFYTDTGEDAYVMWLNDLDERFDEIKALWKQAQEKNKNAPEL